MAVDSSLQLLMQRTPNCIPPLFSLISLSLFGLNTHSSAATIVVAVAEGDWADAATWSPSPPSAEDTVVVNANRVLNVTTDVSAVTPARLFLSNQADTARTGTLNVLTGGKVNFGSVIVSTNTNTGILNVSGGTFTSESFIKLGNVDGSTAIVTVSGGELGAGGSLVIGGAGTGHFIVDGSGSTLVVPNCTVGGGTAGILEFRLDANGASPLMVANYLSAGAGTLVIDGSRYRGDSATLTLVDAKFTNPSSSPFGSVQITGFGSAYAAEIVYTNTTLDLVITATGESPTWATWSLVDSEFVDTEGWMGWLKVVDSPWVYSYSLNRYLYLPESNVGASGGWMYILK